MKQETESVVAGIGIMCKAPRVGVSKTRLIPALGGETAAALSASFLRDVARCVAMIGRGHAGRGYAVFAPADTEPVLRPLLPVDFGYLCMVGETFGHVLHGAAHAILAQGHDCVLLVNGDSPTLPQECLSETLLALRQDGDRVVFSPALDGGYCVIGMKRAHPELFQNIPWSTSAVLEASRQRAREIGLEVVLAPSWYDIDEVNDLHWLGAEFAGRRPPGLDRMGNPAPATRALFARTPCLQPFAVPPS